MCPGKEALTGVENCEGEEALGEEAGAGSSCVEKSLPLAELVVLTVADGREVEPSTVQAVFAS